MSRRNGVPEKWLAGILETGLVAKTALIATRLAEEQGELKGYESMAVSPNGLDDEEKVRYLFTSPWNTNSACYRRVRVAVQRIASFRSVRCGSVLFLVSYRSHTSGSHVLTAGGSTIGRRRVGSLSRRRRGRVNIYPKRQEDPIQVSGFSAYRCALGRIATRSWPSSVRRSR